MAVINYKNAEEQKIYSTVEVWGFYFLISTAGTTRLI